MTYSEEINYFDLMTDWGVAYRENFNADPSPAIKIEIAKIMKKYNVNFSDLALLIEYNNGLNGAVNFLESKNKIPKLKKRATKWSKHYLKCRKCLLTINEHYGGGYCFKCYYLTKEYKVVVDYMAGKTLAEIGREMKLSRERIRQLFERAIKIDLDRIDINMPIEQENEYREEIEESHKFNKAKKQYREIIEKNYDSIVKTLSNKNKVGKLGLLKTLKMPNSVLRLVEEEYPEFLDIIEKNSNKWTLKYEKCRSCGTDTIKHKRWGYCIKCYTKTEEWRNLQKRYIDSHKEEVRGRNRIYQSAYSKRPYVQQKQKTREEIKRFGINRESIYGVYGAKCIDCGITRDEYFQKTQKELSIFHQDGNLKNNDIKNLIPLCKHCVSSVNRKKRIA